MTGQYMRKLTGFAVIATAIFLVAGCSPSVDGKYQDASGVMTLDIHGDKATISAPVLGSTETAVKRDGDKVTLTYQNEPLTLTVKDGNLVGDHVTFTKKQ